MAEVPELAEVEPATEAPGAVELEDERILTAEDVGDVFRATGTVVGQLVPGGFFLRTEGNRVIFVQTTQQATPGQVVRVVGPLQPATVAVFEEWEREGLGIIETEWNVERTYFLDATEVTPIR